jgi:hypothetical protein
MTTASLLHHLVQAISILPRRGRRVSQTFIYQFWQLASEFDRNEQSTYDNSFNLSFLLPSEDFGNVFPRTRERDQEKASHTFNIDGAAYQGFWNMMGVADTHVVHFCLL